MKRYSCSNSYLKGMGMTSSLIRWILSNSHLCLKYFLKLDLQNMIELSTSSLYIHTAQYSFVQSKGHCQDDFWYHSNVKFIKNCNVRDFLTHCIWFDFVKTCISHRLNPKSIWVSIKQVNCIKK